jgi:hypothetical protein
MLKKLLKGITTQRLVEKRSELYRNLLHHEAEVGGSLFGPVPEGGRREFFCLDRYTWVWHEEWVDQYGQHQAKTTRYDIRPNGVLKVQDGTYQMISDEELLRLCEAAEAYMQRVRTEVYAFATA